jgi:hypothetical protein
MLVYVTLALIFSAQTTFIFNFINCFGNELIDQHGKEQLAKANRYVLYVNLQLRSEHHMRPRLPSYTSFKEIWEIYSALPQPSN